MNRKTRTLTLSGLLTASCIVLLYFASVWPTGQVGFAALSSLFVTAAVIEAGVFSGVCVYILGSFIGILLLPEKSAPILFAVFFGYYPIIKSLSEKITNIIMAWVCKLAVFNAALTTLWFILRRLFFHFGDFTQGIPILYLAGNAVFILFDYGYSKVIWLYINRVSKYIGKG